jgi:hypothetical protein
MPVLKPLQIKPLFEKFIGRKDFQLFKDGHKTYGYYDHCQRKPEIILHKTHPVRKSLSRGAYKCDGACLRAHNAQQHYPPRQVAVAQKISFKIARSAALVQAIQDDGAKCDGKYYPVGTAHEKCLVNQAKKIISATSTATNSIYQ